MLFRDVLTHLLMEVDIFVWTVSCLFMYCLLFLHGAIATENGATLALRKLLKRRKIVNVCV